MKAAIVVYNCEGHWQKEYQIILKQVGSSATVLELDKEYPTKRVMVELGPEREPVFMRGMRENNGYVCCHRYNPEHSAKVAYNLARKSGAVAFITTRKDVVSFRDEGVSDIPIFAIEEYEVPSFIKAGIRVEATKKDGCGKPGHIKSKCPTKEDNETTSVDKNDESNASPSVDINEYYTGSSFLEWAESKKDTGIPIEIIQTLKNDGVKTVDQALCVLLSRGKELFNHVADPKISTDSHELSEGGLLNSKSDDVPLDTAKMSECSVMMLEGIANASSSSSNEGCIDSKDFSRSSKKAKLPVKLSDCEVDESEKWVELSPN
eukprot:scaffold198155_cov58-Attheya_sp.AAC.2